MSSATTVTLLGASCPFPRENEGCILFLTFLLANANQRRGCPILITVSPRYRCRGKPIRRWARQRGGLGRSHCPIPGRWQAQDRNLRQRHMLRDTDPIVDATRCELAYPHDISNKPVMYLFQFNAASTTFVHILPLSHTSVQNE